MLSSPVCVPSNSVPLVSPTLALSEAGGAPACLPASVVLCLPLLPSLCAVQGSGGLRGTQLDSGGAYSRRIAERGTQVPETPFYQPLVLTGALAMQGEEEPCGPPLPGIPLARAQLLFTPKAPPA